MKKEVRNSNFELMRIISMIFIIIWHCFIKSRMIITNEKIDLFFCFIKVIIIVHVNSFVLTTGYFQYKKKIRVSKIMAILNNAWFWKTLIIIVLLSLNLVHPSKIEIFRNVFIIDTGQYWFINCYVLLYIISPYINKLIENLKKQNYKNLLIILTLILCLYPTLFRIDYTSFSNNGYTLYHFVYLYLIGAYLNKYPLELKNKININSYKLLLIFVFFSMSIVNFLLIYFTNRTANMGVFLSEFSSHYLGGALNYNNPIIVIQSISYFLLFETFDFKNKFINKVSSLTTGVYLIHMNEYLALFLYGIVGMKGYEVHHCKYIIYIVLISIVIFIVCAILEYIRQVLFKFIYNRKISCKWRKLYRDWIDNCGVKINW